MSREQADTKNYVSILGEDGTFRLSVPEGTPGSVKRDWTVGTGENAKSGTKNESVYKSLSGMITKVEIVKADFGNLLQVTLTDEQGDLTISTGTNNNFGTDLMKKLPNVDLAKEVKFKPYSYIPKGKTKKVKGVAVSQGETEIENFYYDFEKKSNKNGMVEPKGETEKYTTNKWKTYFGEVEDFLIDETKKRFIESEDLAKDF